MKINKIITIIIIILISNYQKTLANEKIKIGLLVPLSGQNSKIGYSIVNSTRLAINKIDNPLIEIFPRDTSSNPEQTLNEAKKLKALGVKIIIGPVFNKNLIYLNELKDIKFLSLTNKVINNPKNIISAGINANSQLIAIKKFQELNDLKKTIFLIPKENYSDEINKAIKYSNIQTIKNYYYDSDPTKLTKQIEKITRYKIRKQNLKDEIKRIENSEKPNKKRIIEKLKKRDTLGKVNFDSIIIADFHETLKSITTSLLYTDISPKEKTFITLNQWFDESLLKETSTQPIYFPSIDRENYNKFIKEYLDKFDELPNQLSFLSYDLVGLIYYLVLQNNLEIDEKIFIKKNSFKGNVGIFEIKNNKINYLLNIYKVENGMFKKIF